MSKDYTNITTNNNGQPFPDTRAIDSTGPLATDGTEWVKETQDDVWLEKQAELDFYNFPPNGLDDEPGKDINGLPISQPLNIKYLNYGTPGKLVTLLWSFDPITQADPAILSALLGIDIRMLLLNGQGIDRTNPEFLALDLFTYVGDADNATADSFYHASDAAGSVRNIAGDFLILADTRGQFLRGVDAGAAIDVDGFGRIVGSLQNDAVINLQGNFDVRKVGDIVDDKLTQNEDGVFSVDPDASATSNFKLEIVEVGGGVALDIIHFEAADMLFAETSEFETRGKNMAVRYAVYY